MVGRPGAVDRGNPGVSDRRTSHSAYGPGPVDLVGDGYCRFDRESRCDGRFEMEGSPAIARCGRAARAEEFRWSGDQHDGRWILLFLHPPVASYPMRTGDQAGFGAPWRRHARGPAHRRMREARKRSEWPCGQSGFAHLQQSLIKQHTRVQNGERSRCGLRDLIE